MHRYSVPLPDGARLRIDLSSRVIPDPVNALGEPPVMLHIVDIECSVIRGSVRRGRWGPHQTAVSNDYAAILFATSAAARGPDGRMYTLAEFLQAARAREFRWDRIPMIDEVL